MTTVGLVVPVHNEQVRLAAHVPELQRWQAERSAERRVLFVDDGSSDGTVGALRTLVSGWAEVLERPHHGKGSAVAAGLQSLGTEVKAFCDLDLSTPLDDLDVIIELARRGPVLAIGSRDVLGARLEAPQGRIRETLGRSFNRWAQLLLTPGVLDTQCGAKAARSEVWEALLRRCSEPGFAWDVELVGAALATGTVVREVPVRWSHDAHTQVRVLRDGLQMARAVVSISARQRRTSTRPRKPTRVSDHEGALLSTAPHHWWFRSRAALVATALRRAGLRSGDGWLVDVGGGTGATTSFLGWRADTTLVVEPAAALARAANEKAIDTVRARAEDLPIRSGGAEVVTVLDVLEHHADPSALMTEVGRILRPGGVVAVLVPAHPWLWSRHDQEIGHLRRYRKLEIEELIHAGGFNIEVSTAVLTWALPAVILVRKVLRRRADGLGPLPRWADRVVLALTSIERHLLGRLPLPPGAALLVIGRAPGSASEGN